MTKKLLTILTRAKTLTLTDGTDHPSGYWAEELCVPFEIFSEAGYDIDIGTLGGVAPAADRSSLDPESLKWVVPHGTEVDTAEAASKYKAAIAGIAELSAPLHLEDIKHADLASYRGVYIAGGHGCMEDMPASPVSSRSLRPHQRDCCTR